MLSHNNIVSNVLDSSPRIPFNEGTSVALSFLPICHIFERVILYIYQYYSVSIYFAESIEKLSDNIKEVKPNVFCAVRCNGMGIAIGSQTGQEAGEMILNSLCQLIESLIYYQIN